MFLNLFSTTQGSAKQSLSMINCSIWIRIKRSYHRNRNDRDPVQQHWITTNKHSLRHNPEKKKSKIIKILYYIKFQNSNSYYMYTLWSYGFSYLAWTEIKVYGSRWKKWITLYPNYGLDQGSASLKIWPVPSSPPNPGLDYSPTPLARPQFILPCRLPSKLLSGNRRFRELKWSTEILVFLFVYRNYNSQLWLSSFRHVHS